MATSAQRREQLEYHLKSFREIADQRVNEKVWYYHWEGEFLIKIKFGLEFCRRNFVLNLNFKISLLIFNF